MYIKAKSALDKRRGGITDSLFFKLLAAVFT